MKFKTTKKSVKNNFMTNYILTNDFKRKKEFNNFRVVSTIIKDLEFVTLK